MIREEEEEVKNEMRRREGDGGVAAADRDVSRSVIKARSVCMMMLSFTKINKSETRTTASVLNKIQTHERFTRTLFISFCLVKKKKKAFS